MFGYYRYRTSQFDDYTQETGVVINASINDEFELPSNYFSKYKKIILKDSDRSIYGWGEKVNFSIKNPAHVPEIPNKIDPESISITIQQTQPMY